MQKYRYLQSFELLTAILSLNPEILALDRVRLKLLSSELDHFFSENKFTSVLEEMESRRSVSISFEDELIIQFKKLNLQYSNIEILTTEDRILMYLCITGWLNRIGRSDGEKELTSRILSIDRGFAGIVESFFNDRTDEVNKSGKDELIVLSPLPESEDKLEGDWVESNFPKEYTEKGTFNYKALMHPFKVLFIGDLKIFIIRGTRVDSRMIKGGKEALCGWELIRPADNVEIDGNIKIGYHDLKKRYLKYKYGTKLTLSAGNISHSYMPGKGVAQFSMQAEGGEFIGILGREGTGKSTVLKLLAGELQPGFGEININGHSLKKELYHVKGMIGYVPEEDLLFDELTVEENLIYAARLYLGKADRISLANKVDQLLSDLDLSVIRNKVVGGIGNKNLQPGQRRILNIALELIREPRILIVDNAASPLSIADTAKIIEILADYSYKGHIVITGITQTDAKSGACFDQFLILDEGGNPVFYGKLNEAWETFLSIFKSKNADFPGEGPVSLVNFISQVVNPAFGSPGNRYKSSGELYHRFLKTGSQNTTLPAGKKVLPENILNVPTLDRQFLIFSLRNFKTAFSRTRSLINTILLSPLMALVFSVFMRSPAGSEYSFSANPYIPSFFYISYLFSVLMGLVISANEIFRERNIIHKEKYLNISFFSYINSKLLYLFLITLIQGCSYILISHLILEVKGMISIHLITFISCQTFGVLLGLILSGSHKSLENLYLRSIPLVILFQIIFGGGFIKFNNFPGSNKYTPVICDISAVRWAYEAMMVHQFRDNDYMKPLYVYNRDIISGDTYVSQIIPLLKESMEYCSDTLKRDPDTTGYHCKLIRTELFNIARHFDVFPYENLNGIFPENMKGELIADINDYIEYMGLYFYSLYDYSYV